MFIELTDHLRCIADHDEQFVVLLPDRMEGRRVMAGTIGCPVCGATVPVVDGAMDFGGPPPPPTGATNLTAEAIVALLGLEGPGGFIALLGAAGGLADQLTARLPGVRFVLINPPAGVVGSETTSVVRAGRLPVKAASMRSLVVSADHGVDRGWVGPAVRAVLPGNRVVIEGPSEPDQGLELLARTTDLWVARRPTTALRR